MKCLILFLGACGVALGSWSHIPAHGYAPQYHGHLALPPGYDRHGAPLPVQDTPEVAAEKSHHLSVLAHAGGAVHPAAPYHGDWTDHDDGRDYYSAFPSYHGASIAHYGVHAHHAALPHHGVHAHHAALAHHAQGHHSALHHHAYAPSHHGIQYHGPIALPPGYDHHGAPLPVQDTHEVVAAKAAHFAAHHAAAARNHLGYHH